MKSLSIYTLTRNQIIEHISKLERQLSGRKFPLKIRTWEWGSMRALAAQLEMHMQEVYSLRFFYSFPFIPFIGFLLAFFLHLNHFFYLDNFCWVRSRKEAAFTTQR